VDRQLFKKPGYKKIPPAEQPGGSNSKRDSKIDISQPDYAGIFFQIFFRCSNGSEVVITAIDTNIIMDRIVADFLVGGHAIALSDRLLTRERGFY
jgi:hypothetical protein